MECYFDNAATTAVFPEVKELMMTLLDVDYGNPSSQHKKGLTAKDYERTATERLNVCRRRSYLHPAAQRQITLL